MQTKLENKLERLKGSSAVKLLVVLFSIISLLGLTSCSSGSQTSVSPPPPPTAEQNNATTPVPVAPEGQASTVPPPPVATKMPDAPAPNPDDMNPHSAKPETLQGRKTVVVATETIPEGYSIKDAIVTEQLVSRTDVPADVPGSMSLVVGRTTKRTIPKGQALQWVDIITKPTVVVAKYYIAGGTAITSDLIEIKESEEKSVPDAIKDKSQVTGRKAARNINAGETLVDSSLTAPAIH